MPRLDPDECRRRFATARRVVLATRSDGWSDLVPVAFALAGDRVVSAVDAKPKSTRRLRRLQNIAADPHVSLLADHYDDADWSRLWWVRARGSARVVEASGVAEDLDALVARYPQYREQRPAGPVVVIDVEHWTGWAAT